MEKIFIPILFILISGGCMTVQREELKKTGYGPVYPATKADAKLMEGSPLGAGCFGIPIGLIDLPFSFVTDTLFLPFDIIQRMEKKERQTEKETVRQTEKKEECKEEKKEIVIPVHITPPKKEHRKETECSP